jgi:hypothetical protein
MVMKTLSTVSPWPNAGVSATTFGVMTVIWLVVVQWISSGFGGYVAGRLRTRWTGLHTDEVYFRDTAHGVLAWAVAAVVSAAVLAGAASVLTGSAATVASGAAQSAAQNAATSPSPYIVDTLFRTDRPDTGATGQDARPEATRILATALRPGGEVSGTDKTYLAQLVAAWAGISQDEAQKRVDIVIEQAKAAEERAKQAPDAARKAAATFSIFAALSMVIALLSPAWPQPMAAASVMMSDPHHPSADQIPVSKRVASRCREFASVIPSPRGVSNDT